MLIFFIYMFFLIRIFGLGTFMVLSDQVAINVWESPYNFISGPTEVVGGLISYYEIISLLDGN